MHLGDPVEDLAAVVGGALGPAGERLAGGHHRITRVLAARERGVGEQAPVGPGDRVGAARLRSRERTTDVELVGLADLEALTAAHAPPSR
jgi:hypothetical protein